MTFKDVVVILPGISGSALAKNGTTVFLSTHSISVAEEICHRIGIIRKGRLISCGTMSEIHAQTDGNNGSLESAFLELTREQDLAVPAVQAL